MIKIAYALCFLLLIGGLLYHFAALKVFNFLVPQDQSSERVASDVTYGADSDQSLYVFKPKQAQPNLPIVIFVHGGSWQEGNAADYGFVGRAFAAKGFVTFVINYRKHPKHPYPSFVQDVAISLKWVHDNAAQFGGDTETIFLVGHSAGAYDISLAVLDQRYLEAAGAKTSFVRGIATLAGPFDFLPLDSDITREVFGKINDLESTQPINYARKDAPPFLILHGTADATVYPKNAKSLFKHLNDVGASAKLIEYQGVSHVGILLDIAQPLRGNAPVLEDVVKFFKDILKQ
jgi:acetyl esterase/lipase